MCYVFLQGVLPDGRADPSRTEVDEAALMDVRVLASGRLLRLGSLFQAAAGTGVRCPSGAGPPPVHAQHVQLGWPLDVLSVDVASWRR